MAVAPCRPCPSLLHITGQRSDGRAGLRGTDKDESCCSTTSWRCPWADCLTSLDLSFLAFKMGIILMPLGLRGFFGGSDSKEFACNVGGLGSISGLGRSPGEGNGYPLQNSCLENPHGQRSLAGYSPWCCKNSNMTE